MEINEISLIILPSWGKTDPPLTLSSLASYLRTNGITVGVYDFNVELYHLLSQYRKWWNIAFGLDVWERDSFISEFWKDNSLLFDVLIDDIAKPKPKYMGFSLFVSNRLLSERFAQRLKIKYPDIKIIFGGPEVSYIENIIEYAEKHSYVDYFIMGEGEESLLNIIRGKQSERIIEANQTIKKLDTLPILDLSDFHFEAYDDSFSFPMYSSRGCPNRCIYCTERVHMSRFRYRTAERVLEDVKAQKQKYPFLKLFRLHESTNNGNPIELERFADLMIKANLQLDWAMNGSVMRKEMDFRLFQKLRKAGCKFINFGLETPSHKVLELNGKMLAKNADFDKIIREANQAGIQVALNIMFGLPGETEEDFQIQLNFLERNHKYISIYAPSLWFCYFPKQSEGYKNPDKYGINLYLGSLYWTNQDGSNNYLIRLERFLRYTSLAKKLGVPCVFGYETLPDPILLVKQYLTELKRLGHEISDDIDNIKRRIASYKVKEAPKKKKFLSSGILKAAIVRLFSFLPKRRLRANIEKRLENILNLLLKNKIHPQEKEFRAYNSFISYMKIIKDKYLKVLPQDANILQKFIPKIFNKIYPSASNKSRNRLFRITILEKTISKIISRYLIKNENNILNNN